MRSKLARSEKSIILPGFDLVDQMKNGVIDLYHQPNSPYHLEENEVVVDLFCGAGGTSQGVLQALGESPAFAVNHNADAIGVHDINHPETIHLESDVFAAAPENHIPDGKAIGLLCASPSCVHFSTARGGKPLDREIRDQAWVVANWCEHPNPRFNPRVVVVENVREFLTWAPLTLENKIDKRFIDKSGLGSTFKEWRARLINAGYTVEYQILNAADYGVPTKRKRLLIVARRDGLPIRFPNATHGPRYSPAVLAGKLLPYRPAWECMDFTIECNPIFMYPADAKKAGANRPLADNTLKRIAAGVDRFVIEAEDPFIVSYHGAKPGNDLLGGRNYTADDQLPTLTTARRGELALVSTVCTSGPQPTAGTIIPMRRDTNAVALDGLVPALTGHSQIAIAIGDLSAVPLPCPEPFFRPGSFAAAPFLTATSGSQYAAKPRRIDQPINSLMYDNHSSLIIPTLVRVSHACVDRDGKKPVPGNHRVGDPFAAASHEFRMVEPFMVTTGYGERRGQAPRIHSLTDPMNTLVACGAKHALIEASLINVSISGSNDNVHDARQADVAPSMPRSLVAAHMAQHNEGNVGHPVTEPVSTMTTKVCHQNLVTSHMLTLRQNGFGQSMDEPVSAFCAAGNHHGEVRACFVKYYGEGGQSQAADEPLDTLTTKPRFAIVQVPVEKLGLTEEQRFEAWWIARFLEIYGTNDEGNPNTAHLAGPRPSVVGRPGSVLWTVQMRMLVPKEAFAASSFPEDYEFAKRSDGKKVSKTTQMQLVGNAVPPGLAQAIIGANVKPRRSVALKMADTMAMAA